MPSIALFIKDLLSEEKYCSDFTDHIEERIKTLNVAQLRGMHDHLVATAKKSHSPMWREANEEIVRKIKTTLDQKIKEDAAEKKIVEEYKLKKRQQARAVRDAKKEKQRVLAMIDEKAHDQAEKEVNDLENQRQAKEKVEIMEKVFLQEERRNKWYRNIGITTVSLCVVAAVLLENALWIVITIIGLLIVGGAIAYYASTFTASVKGAQIAPEYFESEIARREEELRKEALDTLHEKERLFEVQQRRDRHERHRRKREQAERDRLDLELREQFRQEQVSMAKEIMSRKGDGSSFNSLRSGHFSSNNNGSVALRFSDLATIPQADEALEMETEGDNDNDHSVHYYRVSPTHNDDASRYEESLSDSYDEENQLGVESVESDKEERGDMRGYSADKEQPETEDSAV